VGKRAKGLVAPGKHNVQRALEQAGLSPTSLRLEVTEGVIMRDTGSSIRTLQKLKNLGIRLAIDDFGTGYSYSVISRSCRLTR
jgi:EAL domain-containing protein (putative c-di-GMP-specific phosphodiesterase class I)